MEADVALLLGSRKLSKKMQKYLQAERNSRFVDDCELQRLKEKALSSRKKNDIEYIHGYPVQVR